MKKEEAINRFDATQRILMGSAMTLQATLDMIAQDVLAGVPQLLGMSNQEYRNNCIPTEIKIDQALRKERILQYLADGMSTRQVAAVLGVHHSTVATVGNPTAKTHKPPSPQVSTPHGVGNPTPELERLKGELEAAQTAKTRLNQERARQERELREARAEARTERLRRREIERTLEDVKPDDSGKDREIERLQNVLRREQIARQQERQEWETKVQEKDDLRRNHEKEQQRKVNDKKVNAIFHPDTPRGQAAAKAEPILIRAIHTDGPESSVSVEKAKKMIREHNLEIKVIGA